MEENLANAQEMLSRYQANFLIAAEQRLME